ncbi:MAG TPA: hypothetical protein PLJ21_00645 [Pseudobdellovibrionaceae bacterium]|nr:hypothetical protein [Pseudobdellovibrionaceae bacterium]
MPRWIFEVILLISLHFSLQTLGARTPDKVLESQCNPLFQKNSPSKMTDFPFIKYAKKKIQFEPSELNELKGYHSPLLVGFHGTTLESIKVLLQTGHLPPGHVRFDHLAPAGHGRPAIYMAPIIHRVPQNIKVILPRSNPSFKYQIQPMVYHDFLEHQMSLKKAWESARLYAEVLTEDINFLKSIGLDFTDKNREFLLLTQLDFDKETSPDHPWPIELQEKYIRYTKDVERLKSGVILGIHKSIFKELPVLFDGDEGLRIELPPEGLSIKYIYSIIPLGESENYFHQFK